MGIAFQYLTRMCEAGLLSKNTRVLDIGCSNLYRATAAGTQAFLERFGVTDELFAKEFEQTSFAKNAFVGELLEKCGIHYQSLDVKADFNTIVFDLNNDRLPRRLRGSFDLVLNFGTTEHVFNQANAFRVIHEATRPIGFIYHQLPVAGFCDHCYFLYTGRFFFDLAGYNSYRIIDCWYEQGGSSKLSTSAFNYQKHFSRLANTAAPAIDDMPNTSINVIYQRETRRQFVFPMELSTSFRPS